MKKTSSFKKMTCKRRKIIYIREKNWYRLGNAGYFYIKIVNEMMDDVDFVERYIEEYVHKTIIDLTKKFKMDFECCEILVGKNGDDYLHQLTTFRIKFKKC